MIKLSRAKAALACFPYFGVEVILHFVILSPAQTTIFQRPKTHLRLGNLSLSQR